MTENENTNTPNEENSEIKGEENDFSSPIKEIFDYTKQNEPEKPDIRREIKKTALITTVPFLILFGISYYWSYIYFLITGLIGVSRNSAIMFMQDTFIQNIMQIILSTLMFIFPFTIIFGFQKRSIAQTVSLNKPKKNVSFLYYLIGFSFCMLANLLVSLAGTFFSSIGVEYSVDFGRNPQGVFGIILMVISTAVIPALVEEFACRGVVIGLLLPYGEAFAVIVSSVLFGVMHGNFEQIPFAFLVGLILGYVRIKTKSLWVCILIHFSNNMFSVINDYLSSMISNNVQYIFYIVFICVLLVIGVISVVLLEEKQENFDFAKCDDGVSILQKYKWFFTAPTTVLFLILFFVKSFRYFR